MTNEDILKLAETCGIGAECQCKWRSVGSAWEDQLLKFARANHTKKDIIGVIQEGHGPGRYDGYDSAKVSTEMNTMEFDDD
jgi:hypothetical protein